MKARVGDTLYSSGIRAVDAAAGKLAEGAQAQARHAFANLRARLTTGGKETQA